MGDLLCVCVWWCAVRRKFGRVLIVDLWCVVCGVCLCDVGDLFCVYVCVLCCVLQVFKQALHLCSQFLSCRMKSCLFCSMWCCIVMWCGLLQCDSVVLCCGVAS